jgi:ankyrin repeat protein
MSGDDLRQAAVINDHETLREYLEKKANSCSTDAHGLSALHYAVWNGSVECVKLLVMNPNGVDKNGERNSCINLKSSMGYTGMCLMRLS